MTYKQTTVFRVAWEWISFGRIKFARINASPNCRLALATHALCRIYLFFSGYNNNYHYHYAIKTSLLLRTMLVIFLVSDVYRTLFFSIKIRYNLMRTCIHAYSSQ